MTAAALYWLSVALLALLAAVTYLLVVALERGDRIERLEAEIRDLELYRRIYNQALLEGRIVSQHRPRSAGSAPRSN